MRGCCWPFTSLFEGRNARRRCPRAGESEERFTSPKHNLESVNALVNLVCNRQSCGLRDTGDGRNTGDWGPSRIWPPRAAYVRRMLTGKHRLSPLWVADSIYLISRSNARCLRPWRGGSLRRESRLYPPSSRTTRLPSLFGTNRLVVLSERL